MDIYKIFPELLAILLILGFGWLLTGVSEPPPLGGKVNKEKSGLYFSGWNKKKIYFRKSNNGKGKIYYTYQELKGADPRSFIILQEKIAIDNHSVFYENVRQDHLDRATFCINPYGEACDRYGVYTPQYNPESYRERYFLRPVAEADPLTFRTLEPEIYKPSSGTYQFARDSSAVFLASSGKYQRTAIDAPTFRILNPHFSRDKDSIYLLLAEDIQGVPFVSENVELMGTYLRNGDRILALEKYLKGWKIIQVTDPGSVKACFDTENYNYLDKNLMPYLWADQALYLWGELYHKGELDMATLTNYQYQGYYKDKDHVYYRDTDPLDEKKRLTGRLLPEADATSFEYMETNVFRDKNAIYMQGTPVSGIDRDSFRGIEELPGLFKDRNRIYLAKNDQLVPAKGVDPSSFTLISKKSYVCCDKQHVYLYHQRLRVLERIPELNGASFALLKSSSPQRNSKEAFTDGKQVYLFDGKHFDLQEGADPETFGK